MAIFTAGKPLTAVEENQFYQGNVPNRSLMDYIPNVFGGVPAGFEGLLGPEQTQQISQRSNLAGLLGGIAALAQGMGSQGPRRSAFQNIIGAIGAGYGTAGAATEASLRNYANVQQLADAQRKQAALQKFAERYPQYAELARIDPGRAVELVMQMEKQRPIAEAYQNIPSTAPAAAAPNLYSVSAGRAADGGIAGVPAQVTPSAAPITATDQAISQAAGVTTAPVPTEAGYEALPQIPKVNPQSQFLKDQINRLTVANSRLAAVGSKEANDEVKSNIALIDSYNKQLQKINISGFDFNALKQSVPSEYHSRIDTLQQLVKDDLINGNELLVGVKDIQNAAQNKTADIQEYRLAKEQGYKGSFQDWVKFAGNVRATQLNVNTGDLSKSTKGKLEEEILTTGNAITRLNQIKASYRPEYQNVKYRAQSAWSELKDKFSSLPEAERNNLQGFVVYRQSALQNLNQTIKDLTGAAMGVQEAERIIAASPNAGTSVFDGDSPTTFQSKLDNQIKQVQYALARKQYSLNKGLRWESIPLERMPILINERGKEIAKQYNLNPEKNPADMNTVQRQLAAEFGVSF
jgi:hypothetical protein